MLGNMARLLSTAEASFSLISNVWMSTFERFVFDNFSALSVPTSAVEFESWKDLMKAF